MSQTNVRREGAGEKTTLRPAAFLLDAMVAVLEGDPARPIALTPEVYVRAGYLVEALAPEALERANAFMHSQVEPQSIAARHLKGVA